MIPLSEIASSNMRLAAKLSAVLNAPAWWLRDFSGVPLEHSLFLCRTVQHPGMLLPWLFARCRAVIGRRRNWNWLEAYNKRDQGGAQKS